MLNIIRYVNGIRIDETDLAKFEVESDVILKTIRSVNDRLETEFRQNTLVEKSS